MIDVERPLLQWLTGCPVTGVEDVRTGSTAMAVVESAEWLPALVGAGIVDRDSWLLVRHPGPVEELADTATIPRSHSYGGSFGEFDGRVRVDQGFGLDTCRYGMAEFTKVDTPTVLRVGDAHDFSAFLRDADVAWQSGGFAGYLTHPDAVLADVAALGGPVDRAGPMHRVFVTVSGAVSTSPTGRPLGFAGDPLPRLQAEYIAVNDATAIPDGAGLNAALTDSDRCDALADRPWIPRYVQVLGAIRLIRTGRRVADRASGFGGRISSELPRSNAPDRPDHPVILQIGTRFEAIAPDGIGRVGLDARRCALLEALLSWPGKVDVIHWCAGRFDLSVVEADAELRDLLTQLDRADVWSGWQDLPPEQSASPAIGPTTNGTLR